MKEGKDRMKGKIIYGMIAVCLVLALLFVSGCVCECNCVCPECEECEDTRDYIIKVVDWEIESPDYELMRCWDEEEEIMNSSTEHFGLIIEKEIYMKTEIIEYEDYIEEIKIPEASIWINTPLGDFEYCTFKYFKVKKIVTVSNGNTTITYEDYCNSYDLGFNFRFYDDEESWLVYHNIKEEKFYECLRK